jgi:hypothetical protein
VTGGRKRFLYRIVVDTWPTPDGQPFDKQPPADYARAIDAWSNPNAAADCPDWMAGIDWGERVREPGESEPLPGVWLITPDRRTAFTVPAHRRAHYLNPTAARTALAALQAWGAHGHIERSDPITWKGTTE